jgi:aminobenzoyl-glutamate transport protein
VGDGSINASERKGLWAAIIAFVLTGAVFVAMTLIPGAPLSGDVTRPGTTALVPAWSEALIPIILFLFLVPGVVYGIVSGEIRSDRGVANRMTESMSSMGSYIVLAFFAGQAIAWFRQSNLAIVIGVEGGQLIRSIDFGQGSIIAAIVLLCATINLFISSASAKWAFLAPILVPMLASAGMTPELVQAAYRVGDSVTNPIAPLSPYLVIILIVIRRYQPTAGLGTLISLLIPYCAASLVLWTGVLIAWNALGIPLGP